MLASETAVGGSGGVFLAKAEIPGVLLPVDRFATTPPNRYRWGSGRWIRSVRPKTSVSRSER